MALKINSEKIFMYLLNIVAFWVVSSIIFNIIVIKNDISKLKIEKKEYRNKINVLNLENEEMKNKIQKLNTYDEIEEEARNKLNMKKKGEKIYRLYEK